DDAVYDQVVGDAGQARHGDDDGDVRQQDRAEERRTRQRRPPAQEPVCVDSRREGVGVMDIHGLFREIAFAHRARMGQPWALLLVTCEKHAAVATVTSTGRAASAWLTRRHYAVLPASTVSTVPVMFLALSPSRNSTALATSSISGSR